MVAGTDEAGRGCLAGPLVVAAVCLDVSARCARDLSDLDDSKRLTEQVRERLFHAIAPPHRAIVGGDGRSAAIAAASVLAKVTRDRYMHGIADRYPGYGFETHV